MTDRPKPTQEFVATFLAKAGPAAVLTFERFMAIALYDPAVGYYRQNRARVGYGEGTDFFTASTSGAIFGELIAAACSKLLGAKAAADFTFVEIGSESPLGVLTGVTHPFREARTCRIGEKLHVSGPCIVFSNEVFDAQPFRRFVFRGETWKEFSVALRDGEFVQTEAACLAPEFLPAVAPEGYVIDAPVAAATLAKTIAQQPWTGLFVAFDYGKAWPQIAQETPAGTARAYSRHQQSNDLLANPGNQDLTCHICWDWLDDALQANAFRDLCLESQEAFFVRYAAEYIARVTSADAARFSPRKLSLLQLLHPSHLGQKFQVLHAWRE